jgi:glycosyltransferase involved in cell wall biosynthesis
MANEADGLQIECILIDDRGTDNSMAIVNRMIEAYNGTIDFRVITHEKNGGLSAARNTGIEAARGKYIMFVDSDDMIAEASLQKVISILESDTLDLISISTSDESVPFAERNRVHSTYSDIISGEEFLTKVPGEKDLTNIHSIWRYIFSKAFWDRYQFRFKEGIYYEDIHIKPYILSKAKKMRYLNEGSLYYYRRREGSIMTSTPKNINFYSWAVVVNTYLKYAEEETSVALKEHFYNVATYAFRFGTNLLHQLKGERKYVEYYMSLLPNLPQSRMKCNGWKENLVLFATIRFPYTYFKIRKAIYKLTKR